MIHQETSDGIGFRQGGHASHLLGIRQVTDKNITDEVVTFEADKAATLEADCRLVHVVLYAHNLSLNVDHSHEHFAQ
jgi:hypothetical protein